MFSRAQLAVAKTGRSSHDSSAMGDGSGIEKFSRSRPITPARDATAVETARAVREE
jgi:hypothetical protein